jgi:hypothetical protein
MRLWWSAFLPAAALYLCTAQRGPAWQDSGIFQWRMHVFDLSGLRNEGLALAHPLLIAAGQVARMLPVGPETWRYSALSALAAAVATANLAVVVRRLAPKAPAAAYLAAGAFALAHTVWWLATIAESHALLAAIFSGELLALVALMDRPRLAPVLILGLLNGLGVSTHNLALLALPAYGATVVALSARRRLAWVAVPLFALAWCAGASLLLGLTISAAGREGLSGAVSSALFGEGWRQDVLGWPLRPVAGGLTYIAYNFPNLTLPLAAVGLWRLKRTVGGGLALVLGYILFVHLLFAIRYRVPDQFMFFVPFYLMVALASGTGLASVGEDRRRWLAPLAGACLVVGPVVYALGPPAVHHLKLPLPGSQRTLPFRDSARYWLTPWKHNEDSAGKFARQALGQLEEQESMVLLYADRTAYWPLRWVNEVEGRCPTLRLMGGPKDPWLALAEQDPADFWECIDLLGASVWTVSVVGGYCPELFLPLAERRPTGLLYRVRPPAPAGAAPPPGSSSAPAAARG